MQFADPEGAFTNARLVSAHFSHLGSSKNVTDSDGDGVYTTEFDKNCPVVMNDFTVRMIGGAQAGKVLTIPSNDSDYEIVYYNRGADGKDTGDPITEDISAVGKYVVKITAVGGDYKGGVVYIPFDITAIALNGLVAVEDNVVTYNAETHDFDFFIDYDRDGSFTAGDVKLYEGTDYDVKYVLDGTDGTEESVTDVKDAGTYRAVITGTGNYAGEVTLSTDIIVQKLDLDIHHVMGIVSTSPSKPANPYYIWIDGVRYEDGSAIMKELKAVINDSMTPEDSTWFENTGYVYTVTAAKSGDPNITGSNTFTAYKVAVEASFNYGGSALPESHDIYMNDPSTDWNFGAVTGFVADGTLDGRTIPNADIQQTVVNSAGMDVTGTAWQDTPGSYTICVFTVAADGSFGALHFVTVNVYVEAVNADASAAVLFDTDGNGDEEIVTSVSSVYDGGDLTDEIRVVVIDADGNELVEGLDFSVKYYNADGEEVGEIVNAGSYTLEVTSDYYKLSGTTEMGITVGKLDMSNVKASAVEYRKWDDVHAGTPYLPWEQDGVSLDELGLVYLPASAEDEPANWVRFPMDMIKATIYDAVGNELNVIDDEGVYTIKFNARNDDAAVNLVVPADITVTCIKGSHLLFTDVEYTDYYADPVAYVSGKRFMNGYAHTNLFGAEDNLTRGQVACILYNMALDARKVDETKLVYNENTGYVTGFSDVNGKNYYGAAIAWAKQAGVVNGYGDGTFKPEQTVTREEFCAMLANYASKFDDDYAEGSASTLDSFDDAAQVSGWAEKVVAWGVENGIIGNGGFLNAQGQIIRADAACMVYNYANAE